MSMQQLLQGHGGRPLSAAENVGLCVTAAVVTKTLVAPLERVKILVQCQEELIRHGRLCRPYWNTAHCQMKTYDREGTASYWRGNVSNLLRYIPSQFLMFAIKENIQTGVASKGAAYHQFTQNCIAGGIAGAASLSLLYPLDLVRTRLTADTKILNAPQRLYSGLADVYQQTLRREGVLGLYRGYFVSVVGVTIYRGLYFGMYDTLKPLVIGDAPGYITSFLLGYGVTLCAGTISYPFDTIRRRYVIMSDGAERSRGAIDCLIRIVRLEGVKAIMKGAGTNGMRAVSGGAILAGFDKLKILYTQRQMQE